MADTVERTVAHASFWYTRPDKTYAVAMRGEKIQVDKADLERGERFGAFTTGGQPDQAGELPAFPSEGSEAEQDAWVRSAKVNEVLDAAGKNPADTDALLAAEQRRGSEARKTVLEGLATVEQSS